VILGPGSPTFSVTSAGGFTASVSGNTLQLAAPAQLTGNVYDLQIAMSSPACFAAGATCAFTRSIGFDPVAAVADPANNQVVLVAASMNRQYGAVTNGIDDPTAVAYDANGNLFVANQASNTVTAYAPPYTGAPFKTIASRINRPAALSFSGDGTYLAVANAGGGGSATIYAAPSYATVATVVFPITAVDFDLAGNLWFTTTTPGFGVVRVPPPFTSPDLVISSTITSGAALQFDPFGDLFVADTVAGTLSKYAQPNYNGAPTQVGSLPGISQIAHLGNAYLLACYSGGATVFSSTLASGQTFSADSTPCRASEDGNHTLWLTYAASGFVRQYPGVSNASYLQFAGTLGNPGAIDTFPGT
jgi:sugar lactone lactonase YvrE